MDGPDEATPSAALKLAVVGPAHPYKGGVASHTTTLAHHLAGAGHDVTLVSWSHLYPSRLYPGEQAVPGGAPDVPPYPRTIRALSWARPDTWVRAGRRLRGFDAVIIVHVIPAVVPAHLTLLRAMRSGPAGRDTPRAVVIAHNVLPHETHRGDSALMRALFRRVDALLVHSADQGRVAHDLGAPRVSVVELPAHLPGGSPSDRARYAGPPRLLALGMVREYKGVDLLLRALAQVPDLTLTIAGELWGDSGREVQALAQDPRLRDRVSVQPGYVPADQLAALLASHDVLALTYRSATASQNALLGHTHGLPVLASDVGTFGAQVTDGVDGLVVPAGDEAALVAALQRLRRPDVLHQLQEGVHTPDLSGPWAHYIGTLEALASPSSPAADPLGDDAEELVAAEGSAGSLDPRVSGDVGDGRSGGDVGDRRSHGDLGAAGHRGASGSGTAATGQQGWRGRVRHAADDLVVPWSIRSRVLAAVHHVLSVRQPRLELERVDLPDWVRPSDVLTDAADADEARDWARGYGLPRTGDAVGAWAALGALAAIIRLGDDGHRSAVIVDESGLRSPLARWARAVGFAPVELELTGTRSSVAAIDIDPATLDVITRLHPGGCDADDVEEAISQASWALRTGGLLSLTLPLGPSGSEGAVGPADVRGVLARADDRGFVLVGDLDGDMTTRMREASDASSREDAAYALVRLTFRRR